MAEVPCNVPGKDAFLRAGNKATSMRRTLDALAQTGRWLERADESEALYGKRELCFSSDEDDSEDSSKTRSPRAQRLDKREQMISELRRHLESGMLGASSAGRFLQDDRLSAAGCVVFFSLAAPVCRCRVGESSAVTHSSDRGDRTYLTHVDQGATVHHQFHRARVCSAAF